MAYDVKILPTAEIEVEGIAEYLSGFGIQPARRFVEDYRRQLELLASGVIDYGLCKLPEVAKLGYHAWVVNHHRDVSYRVLERVPEKGVIDSTGSDCGNMIIHGDNLEALKALLSRFEGKVDCIYIDPPNPDRIRTCPDSVL